MTEIVVCLRSRLLSEAVAALLRSEQALSAVAADAADVVSMAAGEQIAAVLLDGESAKALQEQQPIGRPVVVLGRREQDVHGLRDAVTSLPVDVDGAELADALRALVRGDLEPPIRARTSAQRGRRSTDALTWLTPREKQVLELVAAASTASEIATLLDVSEHTVRTHVQNLLAKLGATSKVEAVARARSMGLIEPGRAR